MHAPSAVRGGGSPGVGEQRRTPRTHPRIQKQLRFRTARQTKGTKQGDKVPTNNGNK